MWKPLISTPCHLFTKMRVIYRDGSPFSFHFRFSHPLQIKTELYNQQPWTVITIIKSFPSFIYIHIYMYIWSWTLEITLYIYVYIIYHVCINYFALVVYNTYLFLYVHTIYIHVYIDACTYIPTHVYFLFISIVQTPWHRWARASHTVGCTLCRREWLRMVIVNNIIRNKSDGCG